MIDLGALSGQVVSQAAAINNSGLIAGKSNFYPVIWRYDRPTRQHAGHPTVTYSGRVLCRAARCRE